MSAATLLLGAAVVLTGCSALGATPGAGSSASAAASDPSATAVATPVPTDTVAAEAPVVTATPTQVADGRTAVVPAVTTAYDPAAKALDVSAFITSVIEGDGTCTVTVASGSTEKTVTAQGVSASSYTACQAAVTGLPAGSYKVTVKYSSATSVGTGTAEQPGTVE